MSNLPKEVIEEIIKWEESRKKSREDYYSKHPYEESEKFIRSRNRRHHKVHREILLFIYEQIEKLIDPLLNQFGSYRPHLIRNDIKTTIEKIRKNKIPKRLSFKAGQNLKY